MQNEQTLKDLGFQKNLHGEYFWRGKNQTFIGKVVDYNGPVEFVELFLVSKEIDMRPNSDHKGRHYRSLVKDCCSVGSVERAIRKHDNP